MESRPAKIRKSSLARSYERETIAHEPVSSLDLTKLRDSESTCSSRETGIENTTNDSNTSTLMIEEHESTCFGTICFTPKSAEAFAKEGTAPVEVKISERRLLSRRSNCHLATLSPRDSDIIDLFTREGIETEVLLIPVPYEVDSKLSLLPKIMVTLFRAQRLEEEWIGFLQEQMLYLQDPIYTKRNLPYWNPQRFHNDTKAYTSNFWQRLEAEKSRQEEISPIDFLAAFTSDGILAETEGSIFLQTPLQIHQKKALTFMVNREQGWNLEQNGADIWSLKWDQDSQYKYFVNNVDFTECSNPPLPFKGGILADGMGSGKSLSMISLIAHDRSNRLQVTTASSGIFPSRCTLVVMPPHVLQTWDKELSKHLSNKHFSWQRHHGSTKIKNESEIAITDIVLITYPTLASEWRHKSSSVIFRHSWHRVILDEAHRIKDSKTAAAKAAFALKSDRRWVVTGTPIQNRLSELASLFQFLQAFPYSNRTTFDECITRIWSSGQAQQAIDRLKRLLNFTMLRRSQNALNLPGRTDLKVFLDFDDQERIVYDAARDKTMRSIDDLMTTHQSGESYLNALQKINSLRLICNLGTSTIEDSRLSPQPHLLPETMVWDELRAQRTLVSLHLTGIPLISVNCAIAIDTLFGGPEDFVSLQVTKCLRIRCPSCYNSFVPSETQSCTCSLGCSSITVSLAALPVSRIDARQPLINGKFPTKIRHLIRDLEQYSSDEKCIVFSSWKTTLDLAFSALEQARISCVQVDGRVKLKQREQVFHDFTHVKSIRVLLLSLSCGSSGLTLTSASRVYLMEPQWNPSTEEQALSRVYRISQPRDVTTIRYIMDNSIEKHVLAIQDGKKDLITLLLSPPGATSMKMTKKRLIELKGLL